LVVVKFRQLCLELQVGKIVEKILHLADHHRQKSHECSRKWPRAHRLTPGRRFTAWGIPIAPRMLIQTDNVCYGAAHPSQMNRKSKFVLLNTEEMINRSYITSRAKVVTKNVCIFKSAKKNVGVKSWTYDKTIAIQYCGNRPFELALGFVNCSLLCGACFASGYSWGDRYSGHKRISRDVPIETVVKDYEAIPQPSNSSYNNQLVVGQLLY